ncbi:MAG: hypothetical protein K0R18_465 [Bacillales bacterium]|jgi:hypothetical protein|nr:hypothetical protein [Bacillales bacterium]
MTKIASPAMDLDTEILGSGDIVGLSARVVNWNPWYQVYINYDTNTSSFYDGPDVKSAFRMYSDLLTAFKGVSRAEKFAKQIPVLQKQLEQFVSNPRNKGKNDYYHNLLLKKPSFLGFS